MVCVMGIDGGGTKTIAVIADEKGHIYAQINMGESNPTTMSLEQYSTVIKECLESLQRQNFEKFAEVQCCFVGLSGVVEMNLEHFTEAIFHEYYPVDIPVIIENDAYVALYSGTLGMPGVVQIAGTGAITFCLDHLNQKVRSGGFGYLIDDEGSGYNLAVKGLNAVVKAFDYRGEKTLLTNKVLEYFQIVEVTDIINHIYTEQHPRTIIAPLSRYVIEAALEKDKVAISIVERAGEQIVDSIHACLKQTIWNEKMINVVLVGGVFTEFDFWGKIILANAMKRQLNLKLIRPILQPIGGAIVGGMKQLNIPIAKDFPQVFMQQLNSL